MWLLKLSSDSSFRTLVSSIYGDDRRLKHTESGLTANTFTYVQATEEADNGGSLSTDLRIEFARFVMALSLINIMIIRLRGFSEL